MKSNLYSLADIAKITGVSSDRLLRVISGLEIVPIPKKAQKDTIREYYCDADLKKIKAHLKEFYKAYNFVNVPEVSLFEDYDNSNDTVMCNSWEFPETVFHIFRSPKEQVEISITNEKQVLSTHFLTIKECAHIKKNYPNIALIEYKIRDKIFG